jgi:hypothetical protein
MKGRGASVPRSLFAYPDTPIKYRIVKNVPTLTKAVTPTENRILASSTRLVLM